MILEDIPTVRALQPEGWNDIIPGTILYIEQDFCYPVKATLDGQIVASGAAIVHKDTTWLANIIVHKDHRNKGYGLIMTEYLLKYAQAQTDAVMLVATKLGRPVYIKLGFNDDEEYIFFKRQKLSLAIPPEVVPYNDSYKVAILELDHDTTGEYREHVLTPHLHGAFVYLENGTFKGFTIPSLGEGLTLATTSQAGLSLMIQNLQEEKRAALPVVNQAAVNFLLQNGFEVDEQLAGVKMYRGRYVPWKPQQMYGRVGGNMG
jgi:GNAT superfamily N-acetyltransferase